MTEPLVRTRPRLASTVAHVSGLALVFVAVGMAVSALIEAIGRGDDAGALLAAAAVTGVVGLVAWQGTTGGRVDNASVLAAVAWTWIVVSAFGALPYVFAGTFEHLDDALFESVSGFSCSGSTVFGSTNPTIGSQGQGLLFYRNLTQWYGGMGIVVLAVSVLPLLGVGALSLISAEAPGVSPDRLSPRVVETARRFWVLYAGFTLVITLVLWAVPGPTLYDAVTHAFTTASTGGFSTYDESIGHFDSVLVEIVLIVGMIYGAANFALHWRALHSGVREYALSSEFRAYLAFLGLGVVMVAGLLVVDGTLGVGSAIRAGAFNAVSLGTSTGFGNATGAGTAGDYTSWVPGPQLILLSMMIFGGMTGSTSGGAKTIRLQVGAKHAWRMLRESRHPRAVFALRLGRDVVPETTVERIAGFMWLYGLIALAGTLTVTALGSDPTTALGGVVSAMGNMGPALGEAGPTASFVDGYTRPARMALALLMLVGRLELFPMLLLLAAPARSVDRWRRAH